jgi:putative heme iron utilization protein
MAWILRPTGQGVYKKEKSYSKHSIILSSQEVSIDQFFDFIDYDPLNTTADPSKVYILIDEDNIPFRLSDIAGTAVEGQRVRIRSESSEWGKVLVLILGREYRYFSIRGKVSIIPDSIQMLLMSASGYNILNIDLSTARTDQLIAQNVNSFKILESTPTTAIYSIKLFSTTNPPLTQSIIPPGVVVQYLRRASMYLSNPAQSGVTLSILVFTG